MTFTRPQVSIGVPVYNGEPYLAEALDSLLAQSFEDFELVICDNASTDRTGEIGRAYAAQDPRVRYVRNLRNLGAPGNYRRTFDLSRGQYFRWAAADDLSAPQSLGRCVDVLNREPAVVLAYPKTRFIDEHGWVKSDYDDRLHLQSPRASERFQQVLGRLGYCNALYGLMRTEVLKGTGLLGDFVGADIVFQAELSLHGTFWEIPEFLFYRRFHSAASSSMNQAQIHTFYDPDNRHRIWMREWRHLWEYLHAVRRAPLGIPEKLLLQMFLLRLAVGNRDQLARELFGGTRQLLTGMFRWLRGSMASTHPADQPSLGGRLLRASLQGWPGAIRAHPLFNPTALAEVSREWLGGYPADPEHQPHLVAAIEWLVRAHDATGDGGISRGFSLGWNPAFGRRGWQPSYPETTGYIIPTLYAAARRLDRPELRERAERAARWEIEIQLPSGAVRGGDMSQPESPAVFNTGQVLLGWLAAFEETGRGSFADAARRAARYLLTTLDADGHWRKGNSRFARAGGTLYNARTAWALAEAGLRLDDEAFTDAGARGLRAIAELQTRNGWLPHCCLTDPEQPLLHTLSYAIRGLLEGGRVLGDTRLIGCAERAAGPLAAAVREDGWMPGRFRADWSPAAPWSCLTGQAQIANSWMRLAEITGNRGWIEPVPAVLSFLKRTQNRASSEPGLRGGIKGAWPVGADYSPYQVVNWATKFFVDALLRHEAASAVSVLA